MSYRVRSFDDADAPARPAPAREVPLPVFDTRWLWGIVILIPMLVSAGVYWLHQQPAGPQTPAGTPVVEIRLVQETAPAPVVTTRPDVIKSEGQAEPILEAPQRRFPEETTVVAAGPAASSRAPAAEYNANPGRSPRPVPSGVASAFQRKLLSHIARFKRYPANVHGVPQGVAFVMFAMRRDGSVDRIWVQRGSGHAALDEAAAETIRRAQPLPIIPGDLPDRLTILLPVSFSAR